MIAPNLSRGRLFEIQRKSRLGTSGRLFYVYPRGDKEKSIAITFLKPPDDICTVYEKLRADGALEYKTKSLEEIRGGEAKVMEERAEKTPRWKKPKYVRTKMRVENGESVTHACAVEDMTPSNFYAIRDEEKVFSSSS